MTMTDDERAREWAYAWAETVRLFVPGGGYGWEGSDPLFEISTADGGRATVWAVVAGDQIHAVLASDCLQSVRLVPRPPEAIVIQYASRTRDDLGGQFEMVPDADGCWANASRNMTSWFPDHQDRSAAALEVAGHG